MAINFRWTSEADVLLRQCRGSGDSFRQARAKINERFGTGYSLNACIGRAARLGLAPRRTRLRYTVVSEVAQPIREPMAAPIVAPPSIAAAAIPVGSIASRVTQAIRAKAKQAAVPEPDPRPLRCVAIEPRHLTIMELTAHTCRWPYGGWPDEATPISFCGHWCPKEAPYCFDHARIAVRAGTASEQAAHRVSERAA